MSLLDNILAGIRTIMGNGTAMPTGRNTLNFIGATVEDNEDEGRIDVTIAGGTSGPVSSTANAIARFDGTTGQILKDSSVTITDGGNIVLGSEKTVDGRDLSVDGTKLDGIASGATANATDAQLRDRATHTGSQAQSTVTNLVSDLAAKAPKALTMNTQSGTGASAYAFVLTDADGVMVLASGGSAKTFNIPLSTFPVGAVLNVTNTGAGQLTWTCSGGTITGRPGLKSNGTGAIMSAFQSATNVWYVGGDLTT